MLMNTDLKILQTGVKDSAISPSKAELTLWRETQNGTGTPNGNRDAKRGNLVQGQWLQKIPWWEMCSVSSSFSVSLLLCDAYRMSTHSCCWAGRGRAGQQWTGLSATVARVLAAQQSLRWPCEAGLSCFCLYFWLCNYFAKLQSLVLL